jgi:cold shock CspA family protein
MQGKMLWFNLDKGYGYIQTEHDERLYVARSGFLPDHQPERRCKGRSVRFDRRLNGDDSDAVNVSFVVEADARRARLRHSRGGRGL